MILIHVWADGSFTTQHGGRHMSAWAEHQQAIKHGCIATWLSPKSPDGGSFREALAQLAERDLVALLDDPVMGKWHKSLYSGMWPNAQAWHLWASACISDFGAWFEPVTGPTADEILAARLLRLISTRGECSIGVLVNLVRPIALDMVASVLDNMERLGTLKMTPKENPKNHIVHKIYAVNRP